MSPLLNLDFERTDDEDAADLKAYVGVPEYWGTGAGLNCPEFAGCANWASDGGVVKDSRIGVWLFESEWRSDLGLLDEIIEHITVHEVLHAMVPMHHRTDPTSLMNVTNALRLPTPGAMDEALIRFHSHSLVEPGMTMDEVEALIVFEDEVRDPPPPVEPDSYELAWRAFAALQEADSARFKMKGRWRGGGCDANFGSATQAQYEIADFGSAYQHLVHFQDGTDHYYVIDSRDANAEIEYWRNDAGRWRTTTSDGIFELTNWRSAFTSPHRMLASVLYFADANDIEVTRDAAGRFTLTVSLNEVYLGTLSWSSGETLDVVIVLDAQTYEIEEYSMDWRFHVQGRIPVDNYTMEANCRPVRYLDTNSRRHPRRLKQPAVTVGNSR